MKKDYKTIFTKIEEKLLDIGSRQMPREEIKAKLEPYKHFEGKPLNDDECYRKLVHIVFYSGFKAQTVDDKIEAINRHFSDYKIVANYGNREVQSIFEDEEMIKNRLKIAACIENARRFRDIVQKHGSFQAYVNSFPHAQSDEEIIALRNRFRKLFKFLGPRVAFHFMMSIGFPVVKPDRVMERIFKRIGLVAQDLRDDPLYVGIIQQARMFAHTTGHPIRYIDIVFVSYGQVESKGIGIERGICLEKPACEECGITRHCDYYARNLSRQHRVIGKAT